VSSRRLLVAALCLIVGVTGAGATWAAFSASTENTGNSVATGATAGHARVATGTYTGNGIDNRNIAVPFAPHVVIVKGTSTQTGVARTVTMSGDLSKPLAGGTTAGTNFIQSLTATGFQVGTNGRVNTNGTRYDWVAFEAAEDAMQVGTYVGNGSTRSVSGVGFSPEYVMVLPAGNGRAVSRATGQTTSFQFDSDTGSAARITSLDADGFSVGSSTDVNNSGQVYHWIAWNQRGGLTDVSTYTGTGGANFTAYTGFQPAYAIARRNDTATASEAHQRMSSQAAGDSYPFAASGALTDSLTAFNAVETAMGTNAVANTSGATHSLVTFKSRPYSGGGGCSSPGTQTVTNSAADGTAAEGYPTLNIGTTSPLYVNSGNPSGDGRTFVRFNLPAVPSGCSVSFAKLRLYNGTPTTGRTLNVQAPSASWIESGGGGLTWNNQPGVTGSIQSALSTGTAGYLEWSVTDQVRSQYTTNNGFRIADSAENAATDQAQQFNSREAGSNRPQLVVTFQ